MDPSGQLLGFLAEELSILLASGSPFSAFTVEFLLMLISAHIRGVLCIDLLKIVD
jgi:hypothetical protein